MWIEKHAPKCEADLTWSHQKLTELKTSVQRILDEADTKRAGGGGGLNVVTSSSSSNVNACHGGVVLMHGPSGCGKLTTLQALYGHQSGVEIDVIHSVERTVDELKLFLGDAVSALTSERLVEKKMEGEGVVDQITAEVSKKKRAPPKSKKGSNGALKDVSSEEGTSSALGVSVNKMVATANAADDLLVNVTAVPSQVSQQLSSSQPTPKPKRSSSATKKKQSEKKNSEGGFVPSLLRNYVDVDDDSDGDLAIVVDKDAEDILAVKRSKPDPVAAASQPTQQAAAKVEVHDAPPPATVAPPSESNKVPTRVLFKVVKELPNTFFGNRKALDDMLVSFLRHFEVKAKQGVRPTGTATFFEQHPPPIVIVVFLHTIHDTHSEKVDLSRTFPPPFHTATSTVKLFRCTAVTTIALTKRLMTICKREGLVGMPKELVTKLAEQCTGDMRQAVLQLHWLCLIPPLGSRDAPALAPKRSRSTKKAVAAPPSSTTGTKRKRGEVVDLSVDDLFETPPSAGTHSSVAVFSNDTTETKKETGTESIDDGLDEEDRLARATFRNEYIDLGHAAARILVRKYTSDEVLRVISAPAWKLMGYMGNNMHHYFNANQIAELADCTGEASFLEHWFPFSDVAVPISADQKMSEVAFKSFVSFYRGRHQYPQIPRTFLSLGPPKFSQPFFPVSFNTFSGKRSWLPGGDAAESMPIVSYGGGFFLDDEFEAFDENVQPIVEQHELHNFQDTLLGDEGTKPLDINGSLGHIRETLLPTHAALSPTSTVTMDYLPMAFRIVVDDGSKPKVTPNTVSMAAPASYAAMTTGNGGLASQTQQPKRTLFMPSQQPQPAASTTPQRTLFVPSAPATSSGGAGGGPAPVGPAPVPIPSRGPAPVPPRAGPAPIPVTVFPPKTQQGGGPAPIPLQPVKKSVTFASTPIVSTKPKLTETQFCLLKAFGEARDKSMARGVARGSFVANTNTTNVEKFKLREGFEIGFPRLAAGSLQQPHQFNRGGGGGSSSRSIRVMPSGADDDPIEDSDED